MATVQITAAVIHKRKVLKSGTILTVPDDITLEEADNLIRIGVAEAPPVDTTTGDPPGTGKDDSAGDPGGKPDGSGENPVVPEDPQERLGAIVVAILTLEAGNEKHFTTSGLPRVEVIENVLGYNIDSDERNAAWETVQASNAILAIITAASIDDLEALWVDDEDRQSVIDAYNEKMTALEESQG